MAADTSNCNPIEVMKSHLNMQCPQTRAPKIRMAAVPGTRATRFFFRFSISASSADETNHPSLTNKRPMSPPHPTGTRVTPS